MNDLYDEFASDGCMGFLMIDTANAFRLHSLCMHGKPRSRFVMNATLYIWQGVAIYAFCSAAC